MQANESSSPLLSSLKSRKSYWNITWHAERFCSLCPSFCSTKYSPTVCLMFSHRLISCWPLFLFFFFFFYGLLSNQDGGLRNLGINTPTSVHGSCSVPSNSYLALWRCSCTLFWGIFNITHIWWRYSDGREPGNPVPVTDAWLNSCQSYVRWPLGISKKTNFNGNCSISL